MLIGSALRGQRELVCVRFLWPVVNYKVPTSGGYASVDQYYDTHKLLCTLELRKISPDCGGHLCVAGFRDE